MYAIGDLQFTETGTSVGRKPRAKAQRLMHQALKAESISFLEFFFLDRYIFSGYDIEQVLKSNI